MYQTLAGTYIVIIPNCKICCKIQIYYRTHTSVIVQIYYQYDIFLSSSLILTSSFSSYAAFLLLVYYIVYYLIRITMFPFVFVSNKRSIFTKLNPGLAQNRVGVYTGSLDSSYEADELARCILIIQYNSFFNYASYSVSKR